MPTNAEYAQLANRVYARTDENRTPVAEGWTDERPWIEDLGLTGFSAGVYRKGGDIVISFTGTNDSKVGDTAFGNLPAFTGLYPSDQVLSAMVLYLQVKRDNPGANITFTGHSLGGGLASMMAVFFDRPAVVFDPAPFQLGALSLDALASYAASLSTLGFADDAFSLYYTTFPPVYTSLPPVFLAREANVTGKWLEGEFLNGLRFEATSIGTYDPVPAGGQTASGVALHSMTALAAMLTSTDFAAAVRKTPKLLELMLDGGVFYRDPAASTEPNIIDRLYIAQVSDPNTLLLDRFAADIEKLVASPEGMTANANIQRGLIIAAMEYYYLKEQTAATAAFTTSGNGVHFKISDSGTNNSKALPWLVNAVNAGLSSDDLRELGANESPAREDIGSGQLMYQDAWHIQTGPGGMNWTASGSDDDAVVGGAQTDILDAGAGDDILIGGVGRDFLTGGAGSDTLLGGGEVDWLDGGAGNDRLLGGLNADIYNFTAGSGNDTIKDADGLGSIILAGNTLGGGKRKAGESQYKDESTGTYYTVYGTTLSIAKAGASDLITVENWTDGELGIHLTEEKRKPGPVVSPIILDLDGDGVETIGLQSRVHFDHDADGFSESTGWVGSDDGLLVRDLNGDGKIDSGNELFGSETLLSGGAKAQNGFEALVELDLNHDAAVDANDPGFANLRIWRDANGDGQTDAGELLTLAAAGVKSINTQYNASQVIDASSNQHRQVGSFTTTNNAVRTATDVWFASDRSDSLATESLSVPADIAALPDLEGYGTVRSLHQAMVRDPSLKSLVIQFTQASSPTEAGTLVQSILWRWTGADAFSPFSRGPNILEARWLYMVEAFTGAGFVQYAGTNGGTPNDPGPSATLDIYSVAQSFFDAMHGRLIAQAQLKDLYSKIQVSWDNSQQEFITDLTQANAAIVALGQADHAASLTLIADFVGSLSRSGLLSPMVRAALEAGVGPLGADAVFLASQVPASVFVSDHETALAGNDVLDGLNGDDTLYGGGGNDLLLGNGGQDELIAGTGNDTLDGGSGNDNLFGNEGADTYLFGIGSGHDIVINDDMDTPNAHPDKIKLHSGISPSDVALRRIGNDLVVSVNGTADQIIVVRHFAADGSTSAAIDSIEFTGDATIWNAAAIRALTIISTTGDDTLVGFAGADAFFGGEGNDYLWGLGGNDTLDGGFGTDTLHGGVGADLMKGGVGDDFYVVDDAGDIVFESAASGIDSVSSNINLTLDSELENLTITGAAVSATGNALNNVLIGNAGSNRLDGGLGIDTMSGGMGFDTYVIDNVEDSVVELVSEGTDTVESSLTYTLGANFENLLLVGTANLDGAGNTLNNSVRGNSGSNLLNGGAGNDTLSGGYKNSSGSSGIDTLVGGLGDDIYYIDDGATAGRFDPPIDLVVENADEGSDRVVVVGGSAYNYTLENNVEDLYVTGVNSGWATYDSGTYIYRILTGNALDNVIDFDRYADFGAILDGGAGADLMRGGNAANFYIVDNIGDVVDERGGDQPWTNASQDSVEASISYTLGSWLENLKLTGSSAISGTGNALINTIDGSANSAANVLSGGLGNDTYRVGAGDTVFEATGEGIDIVEFNYRPADGMLSVAAVGATNIETYGVAADMAGGLTLLGSEQGDNLQYAGYDVNGWGTIGGGGTLLGAGGNDTLTGNRGWDTLSGGAGDDVLFAAEGADQLEGGEGNDSLDGGLGNDLYLFGLGDGQDIISEAAASTTGKLNTLRFKTGILASQITAQRVGDDVELSITGTTDKVTIGAFFLGSDPSNTSNPIQRVEFADGTVWGLGAIRALATPGAPNSAPVLVTPLQDVTRIEGASIDITLPLGTFADSDVGDALSYSATLADGSALPSWLYVDPITGGISGVATVPGTVSIKVIATDYSGATASDVFDITVQTQNETITGTAGNDYYLYGHSGNDTLIGLGGDDMLDGKAGADSMVGGTGGDNYTVDSAGDVVVENADEGSDAVAASISYTLPTNVESLNLTGTAPINATGNAGNNTLQGNNGNNRLDGGAGADTLYGGGGSDTYVVDNVGDSIAAEYGYVDTDTVESSITWALTDGLENLVLTGAVAIDGTGNEANNLLTGNQAANHLSGGTGADTIVGAEGDDTLDGGLGSDTLNSGIGNDTYLFGRGSGVDVIDAHDATGGKSDTVQLGDGIVTGELVLTRQADDLVLSFVGTSDSVRVKDHFVGNSAGGYQIDLIRFVDGTIWDVAEIQSRATIQINHAPTVANLLNDQHILLGESFNLTLPATSFADQDAGDVLTYTATLANGSSLPAWLSFDPATRTFGGDTAVAGLGTSQIRVTVTDGSGLSVSDVFDLVVQATAGNAIYGTAGDDYLYAGTGNDTLFAGGGNDWLVGGTGDNRLWGEDGNDYLFGQGGTDTLIGGTGDDYYSVDSADDVITEDANAGYDSVQSSVDWTLGANVEGLFINGVATHATGNSLDNYIRVAADSSTSYVLDGGAGADTMQGGLGNDTYVVDNANDVITEYSSVTANGVTFINTGIDAAEASVSYALGYGVENLTLTGTSAIDGTGNDFNNVITGNSAANRLHGGWAGVDTLIGGAGDDTYVVADTGDVIVETAGGGIDTIESSISWTLGAELENLTLSGTDITSATGNATANVLTGNAAANMLDGGLGADTMAGGDGDDTYVVDSAADVVAENALEGNDGVLTSVTYILGANVESLTLTGVAAINGTGNAGANVLTGNDAVNVLTGGAGADTLDGGADSDTMAGGADDDIYIVESVGDTVLENAAEGNDTVLSSVSYVLGANVEALALTGLANLSGTGNALGNTLTGNGGDNILDGGAGADTMVGGAGNDTYIVDNTGDVITEDVGAGADSVLSSASFTLGDNIESLTLTGTAAINATGNIDSNSLVGNSGANTLDGGEGDDTLTGGQGDDIYVVDSASDVIVENAAAGTDTVTSSVTLTLGANVENLTLTGWSAIDGTGNAAANVLIGNDGANTLDGAAGTDTMMGGADDDTYVVDDAGDVITENVSEGADTVQSSVSFALGANVENLILTGTANLNANGNSLANSLTGNGGSNMLDGGAGADTMAGGAGNDTYIVDNAADAVIEAASAGTDLVQSSVSLTLAANVENLTLTTTAAINATGNTLANVLTGNSGVNRIDGGTGADTMAGGAGNDTYVVDNVGDVVTELAAEGTDLVEASITWALAAEIEKLTLTGTSGINGTGNALANTLLGNAGANGLDGGVGADTMTGAAGNDIYVVDNAADLIVEAAAGGTDTVESSINWTLGTEFEKLLLTGAGNINGTGNTLANTLTGNAGNNVLNGGAGIDTLVGGAGDDTYVVDVAGDVVTEAASAGIDTVQTGLTYTLGTNLENLTLTGSSAVNGTGNASANALIGNSGNNTLTAAAGNDTLEGGAGADTLVGGTGNDTYMMGRGYGAELLQENDATAGNTDVMQFLSGIASDQIWFRQVSNDLEVSIIGTTDKVLVQNWYLGSQYHVEQFKTSDGKTLLDSKVQDLVSAMASFTPPAIGQTTLPSNYQTSLLPVIAADWGP